MCIYIYTYIYTHYIQYLQYDYCRVSGDADEVRALRRHTDEWKTPKGQTSDPHVSCSLLKQWCVCLLSCFIANCLEMCLFC